MNSRSKILFGFLLGLVLISTAALYYKYILLGNVVFFVDPESTPGSFDVIINFLNR